jgi:hypothetical protein
MTSYNAALKSGDGSKAAIRAMARHRSNSVAATKTTIRPERSGHHEEDCRATYGKPACYADA